MVRPTMSGMTIERRDQVLIGLRSFFADATCTFLARCRSTNGPFFNERGMSIRSDSPYPVLTALNDHVVRALVVPGLQPLGVLAPRRNRVRITLTRLALTTTVWVIDRVHRETTHRGTNTEPALRTGLAVFAQVVLVIADLTDRGAAVDMHLASLAGLQPQVGIDAFPSGERHRAAGAAGELATLTGLHLDVVHDRADRNVAQGHGVAGLHRRIRARANVITRLDTLGRENVATLAVRVLDQRNVAGAIRIVLHALHHSRNPILVALEVDDAVLLTRAAAYVTGRDTARVIARTGLVLVTGQRHIRTALVQMRAVDLDDLSRTRGGWLVLDESHEQFL